MRSVKRGSVDVGDSQSEYPDLAETAAATATQHGISVEELWSCKGARRLTLCRHCCWAVATMAQEQARGRSRIGAEQTDKQEENHS
jgi:hypothetical protein